jgi:hypothetical protein
MRSLLTSSVTYPEFWRSPVEMRHLQRETRHPYSGDAASGVGDVHLSRRWYISSGRWLRLPSVNAASPAWDVGVSPNFGICDTTLLCCIDHRFLVLLYNKWFISDYSFFLENSLYRISNIHFVFHRYVQEEFFENLFIFLISNSFVQFVNLLEVMTGLNQHLIQANLVNFKNKLLQIWSIINQIMELLLYLFFF